MIGSSMKQTLLSGLIQSIITRIRKVEQAEVPFYL